MSIPLLLAADVGGTRTRLGLFEPQPVRPRPIVLSEFATAEFPGVDAIISGFLESTATRNVAAVCMGVAGRVSGNSASLTNVPWRIEGDTLRAAFGFAQVTILNDLHVMAYAVPVLEEHELHTLQRGTQKDGNMALVAAGTGLGEALLHYVDGRFIPTPSEAGHADFAARTERDIVLLEDLTRRFGRASVEDVLSGSGLVNIHRVTHTAPCRALETTEHPDAPAMISKAAMEHRCEGCVGAVDVFVRAYGAEAGNLALRTLAVRGVVVGGGIARRMLPALSDGRFVDAFTSKAPFADFLREVPVSIILHEEPGMLGAAVVAAGAAGLA